MDFIRTGKILNSTYLGLEKEVGFNAATPHSSTTSSFSSISSLQMAVGKWWTTGTWWTTDAGGLCQSLFSKCRSSAALSQYLLSLSLPINLLSPTPCYPVIARSPCFSHAQEQLQPATTLCSLSLSPSLSQSLSLSLHLYSLQEASLWPCFPSYSR